MNCEELRPEVSQVKVTRTELGRKKGVILFLIVSEIPTEDGRQGVEL